MYTLLLVMGLFSEIAATAVYARDIVWGSVRPERMTRFLLAVITGLSFISLLAGNDRSGVWLALVSFAESIILFGLSLWRGIGGTNRLDVICLALCMIGVGWWLVSGESLAGLLASIIADCIACIPSLVKTVRLPHTESLWFYLLGVISAACVAAVGPYDWRSLLYPLYIMIINAAYVIPIVRPRKVKAIYITP